MESAPRGGTHGDVLDDLDGGRQGPGPEHDGQVMGLGGRVGAGDLGLAAADALLDHRGRAHHPVQDDSQAPLDVCAGDPGELRGPPAVEIHGNVGLIIVADAHRSIFHCGAGEQDLLLGEQRFAFEPAGFPVEALFNIDFVLRGNLAGQGLVDLLPGIGRLQAAAFEGLVDQFGEIDLGLVIHQLEFQLGGLADEVQGPLGVLDAGELDDDLVGALAHQDRLGHPELVDAVAEDLQALGQGAFPELIDFIGCEAQVEDQAAILAVRASDQQVGKFLFEKFLENCLLVLIDQGDGQHLLAYIPFFEGQPPFGRQFFHIGGIPGQSIIDGALQVHLENQVHAAFQIQSQLQAAAHMFLPPAGQFPGNGRKHEDNGDDGEDK